MLANLNYVLIAQEPDGLIGGTLFTVTFYEELYHDVPGHGAGRSRPLLLRCESDTPFPCFKVGDLIDASSWCADGSQAQFRVVRIERSTDKTGLRDDLTVYVNIVRRQAQIM